MLNRLLITGAAGRVATIALPHLHRIARTLVLSDLHPPRDIPDGAAFSPCDLADADAVTHLVDGCDGVLHLGGISEEDSFERILPANIIGVYNLYEAARRTTQPRILFASSNHVIGYYRQDEKLDASVLPRPDSLYGVSKCYGEATASFYHDKFGIETAIVRIGSCFPEPADWRMLATWLSAEDFARLAARVFSAPRLGCPVIYGMSDNDECWWDNGKVSFLGWTPQDSSRQFADRFAQDRPDKSDARAVYQGGIYTDFPIKGAKT